MVWVGRIEAQLLWAHEEGRRVPPHVLDVLRESVTPYREHTVAVACTRDSAIPAVVEPRVIDRAAGALDTGPLTFVDAPALAAALTELSGSRVLPPWELNGPFDAAARPEIRASDITYRRPESLGEALFHYWD